MVKNLLDLGIDPNVRATDNLTPLSIAVQKEDMEVFNLLLENGAEV